MEKKCDTCKHEYRDADDHPCCSCGDDLSKWAEPSTPTLRDRFAMSVIGAVYEHSDDGTDYSVIASKSFSMADAMMKARTTDA